MHLNLEQHANGIDSPELALIDKAVRAYHYSLSLRRVQPSDPDFTPSMPWGIWEENVGPGQSNWVFMVPPGALTLENVLGRIRAGDMVKEGADPRAARHEAMAMAAQVAERARYQDMMEQRRDEMVFVGKTPKSSIRMKINGEDRIIDSEARSPRTYIDRSSR